MVVFDVLRSSERLTNAISLLESRYRYSSQPVLRISYHGILHARALVELLRGMCELQRLSISNVKLVGDLTKLAVAIGRIESLVRIELDCCLEGEDAISTFHTLGCVLANHDRLSTLTLNPRMTRMIRSIAVNAKEFNCLSGLTLMCDDMPEGVITKCFSILQESKTLEILSLKGHHELKSRESAKHVGQFILHNKSIRCLRLIVNSGFILNPVAESLKSNTTLKELEFWSRNVVAVATTKVDHHCSNLEVFDKVLKKHNFTLQHFKWNMKTYPSFCKLQAEKKVTRLIKSINFFCQLNRYQDCKGIPYRKKLKSIENASPQDIVDALHQQHHHHHHHHHQNRRHNKDDESTTCHHLSNVYYFLLLNPSIWSSRFSISNGAG